MIILIYWCVKGDLRRRKANRNTITRARFATPTNTKIVLHKIPRGCACLQHSDRAFQSSHAPLRVQATYEANTQIVIMLKDADVRHVDRLTFTCNHSIYAPLRLPVSTPMNP